MSTLPALAMMDRWDADANFLSESAKKLRGPLNILEAGCGRSWPLDLKGVESPPYPTSYAPIVSRNGIWGFCRKHGCEVLHEHGHSYYVRGKGLRPLATRLYSIGISVLSLGALAWRHDNLTYVIRKNGAGVSPTG